MHPLLPIGALTSIEVSATPPWKGLRGSQYRAHPRDYVPQPAQQDQGHARRQAGRPAQAAARSWNCTAARQETAIARNASECSQTNAESLPTSDIGSSLVLHLNISCVHQMHRRVCECGVRTFNVDGYETAAKFTSTVQQGICIRGLIAINFSIRGSRNHKNKNHNLSHQQQQEISTAQSIPSIWISRFAASCSSLYHVTKQSHGLVMSPGSFYWIGTDCYRALSAELAAGSGGCFCQQKLS
ncbi:Hypothetical predicted protein [Pelobates cultripes]|uniref:Uncharacterized protein n=1 Tax=Pelobates cultripes TaxID=61616 RepID=A0AAD1WYL8_PELCU|nr:Hypothetical predicted protein [Pelobates cultripes]